MSDPEAPTRAPSAAGTPEEGDQDRKGRSVSPWSWIPTVYFAQGLQYSVVVQVFAIAFFTMGVSPGDTLFWVGIISFPWMIKPLWGPLVDKYGTKRGWTWLMQLTVGALFLAAAGSLLLGGGAVFGVPAFVAGCVLALTALAVAAATHDIACDGFYMLSLPEKKQAFFVGWRSAFFQAAMMFANGALIWLAGVVQGTTGPPAAHASIVAREGVGTTVAAAPAGDFLTTLEPWPAAAQEEIHVFPQRLDLSAGETAYATVRLSAPPPEGERRVVVLELTNGSQGVTLPRDSARLEFTSENWNEAVEVPIVADARVRGEVSEGITAQSGNIPLSWSIVALVAAGIFLLVALWHRFILPYPVSDQERREAGRPPFLVAVGYLALTVGIPFLACWGFIKGVGVLRDDVRAAVIGEVTNPALQDLRGMLEREEGVAAVSLDDVWSTVEAVRASEAAPDAKSLSAALALRRALASAGVLGDGAATDRLAERLAELQADASLYGNAQLRRVLVLARELNGGEPVREKEALRAVLARAADPALEPFANAESGQRLAMLTTVESALEGRLPQSREELNAVAQQARETPSRLEEQGFNSLFSVGRLLLLAALIAVILGVPALWRPISGAAWRASNASGIGFAEVFATFFAKPGVAVTLAFLLTYRLGKSQLTQLKNLFLLDGRADGGLGMSLGDVALVNSVTYLVLLTVGSLLGGYIIARIGLRRAIWPMVGLLHLPNLLYLWLSVAQPTNLALIHVAVGIESFGHGFGFAAYLVIMMIAAQGPYKTAHYALCTGFMAIGNMIPGMWAGYLQELVGYNMFFILVMVFSIPGTILIPFLKLDMTFGTK